MAEQGHRNSSISTDVQTIHANICLCFILIVSVSSIKDITYILYIWKVELSDLDVQVHALLTVDTGEYFKGLNQSSTKMYTDRWSQLLEHVVQINQLKTRLKKWCKVPTNI